MACEPQEMVYQIVFVYLSRQKAQGFQWIYKGVPEVPKPQLCEGNDPLSGSTRGKLCVRKVVLTFVRKRKWT